MWEPSWQDKTFWNSYEGLCSTQEDSLSGNVLANEWILRGPQSTRTWRHKERTLVANGRGIRYNASVAKIPFLRESRPWNPSTFVASRLYWTASTEHDVQHIPRRSRYLTACSPCVAQYVPYEHEVAWAQHSQYRRFRHQETRLWHS